VSRALGEAVYEALLHGGHGNLLNAKPSPHRSHVLPVRPLGLIFGLPRVGEHLDGFRLTFRVRHPGTMRLSAGDTSEAVAVAIPYGANRARKIRVTPS
jgi:hypothetical protein